MHNRTLNLPYSKAKRQCRVVRTYMVADYNQWHPSGVTIALVSDPLSAYANSSYWSTARLLRPGTLSSTPCRSKNKFLPCICICILLFLPCICICTFALIICQKQFLVGDGGWRQGTVRVLLKWEPSMGRVFTKVGAQYSLGRVLPGTLPSTPCPSSKWHQCTHNLRPVQKLTKTIIDFFRWKKSYNSIMLLFPAAVVAQTVGARCKIARAHLKFMQIRR